MEKSIFKKIIDGEIPAHKVFEDERTLVFLDIYPAQKGHMLVIPKIQVDRLEDLPEEDYMALMETVKRAMLKVVEVFGQEVRACLKTEGFDIPHAHIHVIPCHDAADFWAKQRMDVEPDHEELAVVAKELSF